MLNQSDERTHCRDDYRYDRENWIPKVLHRNVFKVAVTIGFHLDSSIQMIRVPCGSIGFSKSSVAELPALLVRKLKRYLAGRMLLHRHVQNVEILQCPGSTSEADENNHGLVGGKASAWLRHDLPGPDVNGQQQKTLVNDQKAASPGGREGRIKERIIEQKAEKYQGYGQSIGALAKQYTTPNPEAMAQARQAISRNNPARAR